MKAHVDNSLIKRGVKPCVVLFEGDEANGNNVKAVQEMESDISEEGCVLKGIQDVFLPQIEESESETGILVAG